MDSPFRRAARLPVRLITHQAGDRAHCRSQIDLIAHPPTLRLMRLLIRGHGLEDRLDEPLENSIDAETLLPFSSLYARTGQSTARMLRGLHVLISGIRDGGTRFFRYVTTMSYAMRAAAGHGPLCFVFERPDPLDAAALKVPSSSPACSHSSASSRCRCGPASPWARWPCSSTPNPGPTRG